MCKHSSKNYKHIFVLQNITVYILKIVTEKTKLKMHTPLFKSLMSIIFFYVFKSEMKNYLNMLHKNPLETVILSKIVAI